MHRAESTAGFGRPMARLHWPMGWAEQTGHAVLWALLVGFTAGVMAPFNVFAPAQFVNRRAELVPT
ncbi:MAG: hypothetical protein OXI77_16980 [Chloroflexota bacterium]|nr:hypothetical protein [Chloroflexota bacterium]